MECKLFVMGLPGSGKSTISRHIAKYVLEHHQSQAIKRINDYDILKVMFEADSNNDQFRPAQDEGFDIHDLTVFDTVLQILERNIRDLQHSTNLRELFIIEFSRNDYIHALKNFTTDFLGGSYFLFLDADLDICRERIRNRVAAPRFSDDHFVSEYIFERYYAKDEKRYSPSNFSTEFGIKEENITIILNNGQFEDIKDEVNHFVDFVIKQESYAAS